MNTLNIKTRQFINIKNRRLHICFLTSEYPKSGYPHGGIGTFVKTIATQFAATGMQVSVVGVNNDGTFEHTVENGISIYRVKKHRIRGLTWFLNSRSINKCLKDINQKSPIDIIEASELGFAFLNKVSSAKLVIRLHGGHHFFAEAEDRSVNWWKGFQEKRSFKKADAFIAVSNFVKSHTGKYLSFHKKPVDLISNAIDTQFFAPQPVQVVPFRIVFAGTVCEKKGIRQLIQAFPVIRARFKDATLEIYGRDWLLSDGTSYIAFLKQTELINIGGHARYISFHGAVGRNDLRTAFASASVCAFPSHMETQGLVAPEAMAMEKAVVFTNRGPGPETIVPYKTGLLCDPLDPVDIADKICWVFENPEAAAEVGANARRAVIDKFDLQKTTAANIQFYRRLLQ